MSFGSKSLPKQTLDETHRIEQIIRQGCIACKMEGEREPCCEIHHLLVGGLRVGHRFTVGLCPHHHRTGLHPERGPSLGRGSKPFHERYGDDNTLLEYQDRLIGWEPVRLPARRARMDYERPSKVFPR